MAVNITPADVALFVPEADEAQVNALVVGALARAAQVAPCILSVDFAYADAAKAVVVEAIVRRLEAGAGSLSMQQAGPFQQAIDTRTSPRVLFWPAEIAELQRLCEQATDSGGQALPLGHFPAPRPVLWPDAIQW